MKFLPLHLFQKEVEFANIQGYDDLKDLVRRALSSDENYNLLFVGPPASAKTLFLLGILERRKGVYFDKKWKSFTSSLYTNPVNRPHDFLARV